MNENEIHFAVLEIGQKPLELRAVVRLAGEGAIGVALDDEDMVGSCPLIDRGLLGFDGGFVLPVGGIAGIIDGCEHGITSGKTVCAYGFEIELWKICG